MGGGGGFLGNIGKTIGSTVGGIFGNTGGGEGGNYIDPGARPNRPDFISALQDPNTGQLKSGYEVQGSPDVSLDTQAADALQQRALAGPGTSPWENLMRQQLGTQQATGRSNLLQQNASDLAQARSQLASQKGLSGGANERLAMNAQRAQQGGMQNLANQGNMQGLQIGTQAEQQRMGAQQQAAQNALNAANFGQGQRAFDTGVNQYNIQNKLGQLGGQNAANLAAYQSQMKDWAGAAQSNAMSQANNRGKK